MTISLFEQFDAADNDLSVANDDIAAKAALDRQNAVADQIMYDRDILIELRFAVALTHCESLCHSSSLDVFRKILAA